MSDTTTEPGAPSALASAYGKVKSHGLKYSAVSMVNVAVGQGLLVLFTGFHLGPTTSNILAVCLSAVPAYYMNRAWVWGKKGKSHFRKEILPFWGFALLGLLLSSITVTVASAAVGYEPGIEGWRRLVPNLANMFAFGILWVAKFFVLDAMIFGAGHHVAAEMDDDDPTTPDA